MIKSIFIGKYFVYGIGLLFIGTCVIPGIAQSMEKTLTMPRGNWLYVGGSGPGNYSRIQDAIENASAGDTIFVYHGTYYGYIRISQLTLIGEDKNTTIIDGGGSFSEVLHIGDEVTIQGFTIQNTNHSGEGDVAFFIVGNEITISNNIITQCGIGIYNFYGKGGQVHIFDNIFSNITGEGISFLVFRSANSEYLIRDNVFFSNHIGIRAEGGKSVQIEHNHFENNDIAISLIGSHATILQNNFIKNDKQVEIQRIWNLQTFLITPMFYKPSFTQNYWDDWVRTIPRPFLGTLIIFMLRPLVLLGILPGEYIWYFFLPILIQFDWHPAQGPYDI
jgi:nitrous oxidase accessory protein NosD